MRRLALEDDKRAKQQAKEEKKLAKAKAKEEKKLAKAKKNIWNWFCCRAGSAKVVPL